MCVSGNEPENFRLGRHTYFSLKNFFLEKIYDFIHFERLNAFQIAKIIFFPEDLKISRFHK